MIPRKYAPLSMSIVAFVIIVTTLIFDRTWYVIWYALVTGIGFIVMGFIAYFTKPKDPYGVE